MRFPIHQNSFEIASDALRYQLHQTRQQLQGFQSTPKTQNQRSGTQLETEDSDVTRQHVAILGKHEPSELTFPPGSKAAAAAFEVAWLPDTHIPWPFPPGGEIPGPLMQKKLGVKSPEQAIKVARKQIDQLFKLPDIALEVTYNARLEDAGRLNFQGNILKVEVGNNAFRSPDALRATLVHEFVHVRHFVNERLFQQPLGQSEIEAYDYVLSQQERLGLSPAEIEIQQNLREVVLNAWKNGTEPGYAVPVDKPAHFETLVAGISRLSRHQGQ